MFADVLAVSPDLGAIRILLCRHEVELFEQRDVAVRIVVALDAGKAVPIPDTTEIPAHLDDAHVFDAGLLQVCASQETANAATDDSDVYVLRDRIADERWSVWVDLVVLRELTRELDVLFGALGAKPLGALLRVLLPQRGDVDVVGCIGRPARVEQCHVGAFSL